MDTAVVPLTTFKTASWSLRKRRVPTFDQVRSRLQRISFMARTLIILAELNPARYAELHDGFEFLGDTGDQIVVTTLNEICEIAPLDMEFYENSLGEYEEIPYLQPSPCGFPMGWDEWEEIVSDPSDCSDSMGLFVFVTALRLGEGDVLTRAGDHFGWNMPAVDLGKYGDVDFEKLYKSLDKAGLSCFKSAIDVCLYSTGNPYFDYNPYDEGVIPDLPPYSLEGVQTLEEMWQAAQPISIQYKMAEAMFEGDKELSWKILKLWLRCSEKKKRVRVRSDGRTLAEMWGDIEEVERVIDPFYGPLDGQDEEEVEE